MTTRSFLVGAAILLSIAASSPALAQDAEPTPEQITQAREAYAAAEVHYEAGRYSDAEASFWQAYNAVPNPVILVGLARSQARQGNYHGAKGAFERYLAARPDAPDREAIESEMAEYESHTGVLRVETTQPGAAISINGQDTGEVTPADIELLAGDHMVRVSRTGQEIEQPIRVEETGTEVLIPLGAEAVGVDTPSGEAEVVNPDPFDLVEEEEEGGANTAVWVTSGIAAAGLVTGTVLGFLALSEEDKFDDAPSEATADRGERLALFADVSFAVAGASALTALILFLTQDDGDDEDESEDMAIVAPMVGPTVGGLSAQVGF